jgi:hypothetical protein
VLQPQQPAALTLRTWLFIDPEMPAEWTVEWHSLTTCAGLRRVWFVNFGSRGPAMACQAEQIRPIGRAARFRAPHIPAPADLIKMRSWLAQGSMTQRCITLLLQEQERVARIRAGYEVPCLSQRASPPAPHPGLLPSLIPAAAAEPRTMIATRGASTRTGYPGSHG